METLTGLCQVGVVNCADCLPRLAYISHSQLLVCSSLVLFSLTSVLDTACNTTCLCVEGERGGRERSGREREVGERGGRERWEREVGERGGREGWERGVGERGGREGWERGVGERGGREGWERGGGGEGEGG